MKIAINALFFQHPATGSGQYLTHLTQTLADIDQKNEYLLLGPRPEELAHKQPLPYQVSPVPALAGKNENIEKVLWEQFTAPAAARGAGAQLYHVPYFAPPLLPRTPTITSILDVIPLRLPAYRPDGKVKAYMSLVARAAQRANLIITISQHAKQEIVDVLHIPPERIRVTYLAAGDEYRPVNDPATLAAARARYGVGERFIFYLGGMDHRKNVPQLVRAFAQVFRRLGDPALKLLIAGNPAKLKGPLFPDPRPVASELGISEQIVYHFIEEEDKAALYSAASVFVFPSSYEGFGLDPLEAMACGAPVVCSNRTSLPEVVDDAAISVDPDDTYALSEGIHRVLSNDLLQATMRINSVQRAKQFSWHKTAQETLAVYEEVLASRKR